MQSDVAAMWKQRVDVVSDRRISACCSFIEFSSLALSALSCSTSCVCCSLSVDIGDGLGSAIVPAASTAGATLVACFCTILVLAALSPVPKKLSMRGCADCGSGLASGLDVILRTLGMGPVESGLLAGRRALAPLDKGGASDLGLASSVSFSMARLSVLTVSSVSCHTAHRIPSVHATALKGRSCRDESSHGCRTLFEAREVEVSGVCSKN